MSRNGKIKFILFLSVMLSIQGCIIRREADPSSMDQKVTSADCACKQETACGCPKCAHAAAEDKGTGCAAHNNCSGQKKGGCLGRPAAKKDMKAMYRPSPQVAKTKAVQQALKDKGAQVAVDGVMGPRTINLIRSFQAINGLPVTGKTDPKTLELLGVK